MFLAKSYCDFRYIEKHFSVCRDEKVIDDVRNRVAAYEDSIRHHHEMVEMAAYKGLYRYCPWMRGMAAS